MTDFLVWTVIVLSAFLIWLMALKGIIALAGWL